MWGNVAGGRTWILLLLLEGEHLNYAAGLQIDRTVIVKINSVVKTKCGLGRILCVSWMVETCFATSGRSDPATKGWELSHGESYF